MTKKFKHSKNHSLERKRTNLFIIGTLLFILVSGLIALIVCWSYYKWEWSTIAYWLNPFSEGNQITWVVYIGIVLILLVLVWMIHINKVNKNNVE